MPTRELGPFRGIDARPGAADKPGGLLEGLNVIVAADGGLIRRPALTVRATLPAACEGLFSVGDQLRTVSPLVYDERLETDNMALSKPWVARTAAATNFWISVTHGNNLFVAVSATGTGNRVMTSANGTSWDSQASAADNQWYSVCFGNNLFVAVSFDGGGSHVMTSPNGITWTLRTTPDRQWVSVCFGNNLFVAVGNSGTGNRVMTSPDGITWTLRASAADIDWLCVTYGAGLFVAVAMSGTGNRVMTSPDGITWTSRTSAADNVWTSVTYGAGLFVATSTSGPGNRVMTSANGITWTLRTAAADNQWHSVTFGGGVFVAVAAHAAGNRMMTSLDGITWTLWAGPADSSWYNVGYGSGVFVAVALEGSGGLVSSFDPLNSINGQNQGTLWVRLAAGGANPTAFLPATGSFRIGATAYTYSGKTAYGLTGLNPLLAQSYAQGVPVLVSPVLIDNDVLAVTISVDYITNPTPKVFDGLIGHVTGSDGRTVALVHYSDESTDIHRCPDPDTEPLTQTKVSGLGFTPEFSLVRAAGRAFCLDGSLRYLRYSNLDSATPDSLVDFITNRDLSGGSGFLEVSQFAAGAGEPQGLALFGGRIVVLYRGALLIYRIDADQQRFFLEQQINGPGTTSPQSVVELGADTIFLSDAGVRVLSTVVQTLDAREDAIGGRIDHLAKAFTANVNIRPIGIYARRLGCYLLGLGQDVLCLGVLPGSAVLGWTRWRLPVAVEGWAEAKGLLWMRSGQTLYAFEDTEDQDEVSLDTFVDVPVLVETLPMRGTQTATAVSVSSASVEPVMVQVVADGRPGVDINNVPLGLPITLPPRAPEPARAIVGKVGRTFSVRVYDAAAKAGWRLDNLWLEVSR